jgi:hypothetical protein
MTRKVGIAVSLVLAFVFTLMIARGVGQVKEQEVEVARVKEYVAAGEVLGPERLEAVKVPAGLAQGAVPVGEAAGRPVKFSLVKGQLVMREVLDQGQPLKQGCVEVYVPVDLASSALVLPGQVVNVYAVAKQQGEAPALLLEKVRVLHSVAGQGQPVGETKSGVAAAVQEANVPAAVGLEVPADKAAVLAQAAAQKAVYLARVP